MKLNSFPRHMQLAIAINMYRTELTRDALSAAALGFVLNRRSAGGGDE